MIRSFCLSGRLRVVVGDGEAREFGAGAIWRMEDVTGSGHTTTVLGDEDVRLAIVQLPPRALRPGRGAARMTPPAFFEATPALDTTFRGDIVSIHAARSDAGLVAFFRFHPHVDLPPHAHGAQWGPVVAGWIDVTIGGETRTRGPGDSDDIPAGFEHGARIAAGALVIDVCAEPDRCRLKDR